MVHERLVARLLVVEFCLGQGEGVRVLVGNLAVEQQGVARIERREGVEVAHFLWMGLLVTSWYLWRKRR